ncbi:MAG: divergent polysaccharide deacetylase family protein, partial [Campylobacterales bacterium]|nr:divergent polysaccharide deacetylase family protein [Campylobacterales bacterium]
PERSKAVLPPEPEKPRKSEPVEPTVYEETQQRPSEVVDYEKSLQKSSKTVVFEKKPPVAFSGRPKLVIIIDDVSFAHHVPKIKEIPFKITPSILPPTARHPDSHTLANEFSVYMVHLPLEALSHNTPEEKTLKVGDTEEAIQAWIRELKTLFPKALYYNNHTGSRFTAHLGSMEKLLRVLKKEKLVFLDSRTTPHAKAPELAKKYGMLIHSRDVFLDNSYEKEAIRTQLKEAVRLAKRNGQAIAIGHPHANTLSVLAGAKEILAEVDVVYVGEL